MKFSLALCLVALCMACGSTKQATTTQTKQLPHFDYSVKSVEKPASAGITIALIDPTFPERQRNLMSPTSGTLMSPFGDMAKAMRNDFEELLTSKGFTILGPYRSIGDMVYNQMQQTDLILTIEIDLTQTGQQQYKQKRKVDWGAALNGATDAGIYSYTYTGSGSFGGYLNLTILSRRQVKLWKKNILLQNVPYQYTGSIVWKSPNVNMWDNIREDAAVYNAIITPLERMYTETLRLVESQIEVEELKGLMTEAKKADGRQ